MFVSAINIRVALLPLPLLVAACATPSTKTRSAAAPLPTQRFAVAKKAPPKDDARRKRLVSAKGALDARAQRWLKKLKLPGMVAGIVLGDELIWSTALGHRDAASKAPMAKDTVFRIGSLTKPITGMALLLLRDEGKLRLDDPVARYVPEIAQVLYPSKDSPRITIRHLVTHTSGLPRLGKLDYTPKDAKISEASLLAGLRGLKLQAAPGTRTAYSNLAMGLAGVVVSRASGVPYRDFVSKRLLAPLKMSASVWDRSAVPQDKLASGYRRRDGKLVQEHHWRLGAAEALGGLYSNLPDMARLVSAHLAAWPPRSAPDSGPVRRASLRESHLLAGFSYPSKQSFGVNWGPVQYPTLGYAVAHAGGTYQYAATIWMLPKRRLGAIVLANGGGEAGENALLLSRVAVNLLMTVSNVDADPAAKLSKELEAAASAVRALLAKPEEAAIRKVFTPRFIKAITLPRIRALLAKRHASLGECASHHAVRRLKSNAALVELRCAKGAATVTLYVTGPGSSTITGFAIGKVRPR